MRYRRHIDAAIDAIFKTGVVERDRSVAELIELGVNHEQQHQELILTDILALFAAQPLRPAYRPRPSPSPVLQRGEGDNALPGGSTCPAASVAWGTRGSPSSTTTSVRATRCCCRTIAWPTASSPIAEWLEFMADGGYATPAHWLSDGWAAVNAKGWTAPRLLGGRARRVAAHDAARARARRSRCSRLPRQLLRGGCLRTLGRQAPADGVRMGGGRGRLPGAWQLLGSGALVRSRRPRPVRTTSPCQMFGDVWEWTQSAYSAYPGFRAGRRRARRVQRQVHVRPVRAARRLLRHARRHIRARPTATSSIRISAGSSPASDWQTTHDTPREHDASIAAAGPLRRGRRVR